MSQHHLKNTRLVNNSLKCIWFLQHTKSNLWFLHACGCNWLLDFRLSSSAGTAVQERDRKGSVLFTDLVQSGLSASGLARRILQR